MRISRNLWGLKASMTILNHPGWFELATLAFPGTKTSLELKKYEARTGIKLALQLSGAQLTALLDMDVKLS